jgi:periplasmic divalent cation tolerance protein
MDVPAALMSPGEVLQVTVAAGTREEADGIAAALVEHRLAACVQVVGPVTSRYRWEGQVETATEWLCLAKTTAAAWPDVQAEVRRLHSYEVPEVVAVPVTAGTDAYLDWVRAECRPRAEG